MPRVYALLFDAQQVAILQDALEQYTTETPCECPATRLRDKVRALSFRFNPTTQEGDMRDFGTLPKSLRLLRDDKGRFK